MNHIFLTGEIQVGKSTIVNKICQELSVNALGFHTLAFSSKDLNLNSNIKTDAEINFDTDTNSDADTGINFDTNTDIEIDINSDYDTNSDADTGINSDTNTDKDFLYILPYATDKPINLNRPFGERNRKRREKKAFPEVFDVDGVQILCDSRKNKENKIIIMDELGFFENDASLFQNEIFKCLNEDVFVLGVIKPQKTEFLDKVRAHSKVDLFNVTVKNREEVYISVKERVSDIFPNIKHNEL